MRPFSIGLGNSCEANMWPTQRLTRELQEPRRDSVENPKYTCDLVWRDTLKSCWSYSEWVVCCWLTHIREACVSFLRERDRNVDSEIRLWHMWHRQLPHLYLIPILLSLSKDRFNTAPSAIYSGQALCVSTTTTINLIPRVRVCVGRGYFSSTVSVQWNALLFGLSSLKKI